MEAVSKEDGCPTDGVCGLAVDNSGALWVSWSEHLIGAFPGEIAGEVQWPGRPHGDYFPSRRFVEDENRALYANTPTGPELLSGRQSRLPRQIQSVDDYVRVIESDGNGGWWAGTWSGLWRSNSDGNWVQIWTNRVADHFIGTLFRDRQNLLWIGIQHMVFTARKTGFHSKFG